MNPTCHLTGHDWRLVWPTEPDNELRWYCTRCRTIDTTTNPPSDRSATTPNVPDLDREPDNAEQLAAPSEG